MKTARYSSASTPPPRLWGQKSQSQVSQGTRLTTPPSPHMGPGTHWVGGAGAGGPCMEEALATGRSGDFHSRPLTRKKGVLPFLESQCLGWAQKADPSDKDIRVAWYHLQAGRWNLSLSAVPGACWARCVGVPVFRAWLLVGQGVSPRSCLGLGPLLCFQPGQPTTATLHPWQPGFLCPVPHGLQAPTLPSASALTR